MSRHDFQDDLDAIARIGTVPLILELVCRQTGMGYAAIARVTDTRWVVCQARDTIGLGLAVGDELPVSSTLCAETRAHRRPILMNAMAPELLYAGHPPPPRFGFQSYLAIPVVRRSGEVFGTLCAFGAAPVTVASADLLGTMTLMAELVAMHLDADERLASAEATRELNDRLEQRLAERSAALRLYENIFQSDSAPVCAFDTDYRVIAFNKAHLENFHRIYNHWVKIGDVFPDLFLPEQGAIIRSFMARALAGETFTATEEFGDPDLEKPHWEVAYNPLWDESGKVIGAFHHAVDVSARMRTEAELMAAQAALRQSQKMEAVGQLTGGLAHDFNNLLTGMTGSLEMVQTRIEQGRVGEVHRFIDAAQGAAKRAASLTHRLLAFSRRQTLDPKPTVVSRLVGGIEELIRRTVGPEIAVEPVSKPGPVWPTLVDPGQLENALLNLCINARDAMPDGGRITIETGSHSFDHAEAAARELPTGQYVSLCVSDTGTGMTPEVIARAFEPFYTTKPLGLGTGLGLSMIYGFARQSGGQARISSAVGQGTTVCLYLPRFHGEVVPPDPVPEPGGPLEAPQGLTVLVVDDDATVRMLVMEVLNESGYRAIEAVNGQTGLQHVQSPTPIDLLVTDVGLPGGMNGRQMADGARLLRPDLKVLFITGYAETAALSHGLLGPNMHVLTKPFTLEALNRKVREVLAE